MSSRPDFPPIDKQQLFARLGEGAAARTTSQVTAQVTTAQVTVVTPNRRLSSALIAEYDAAQAAAGHPAWEAADVLPLSACVERLYGDALYGGAQVSAGLPLLLGPAQEQLLWEEVISASEWGGLLLSPARAAEEARKAWTLAHQWNIAGMLGHFPGNEDAAAFAAWAAQYRRRTAGQHHVEAARLPDLAAQLLAERRMKPPATLVLYAFDIVTPQTRSLLAACAEQGTQVFACHRDVDKQDRDADANVATAIRWPQASTREELERAAAWARTRLEAALSARRPVRIGIVVPELEQRRKEVVRVLSRILDPTFDWPGMETSAQVAAPLFNLSLGVPLTQYPLVHAALGLLSLAQGSLDHVLASRLLRSPFLAGGRSEAMARAQLDVALRRLLPPRFTLPRLIAGIQASGVAVPLLDQALRKLYGAAEGVQRRAPHEWSQHYAGLLSAAGFPGERSLDSAEYQTWAKWNEALAELGTLSRVSAVAGAAEMLGRLRRLCAGTLFQPESGTAPIQVLGVLESAGMDFDHLWVSGLTDEAWPLPARPHAFIPPALQKKAGVPEAAAETALELDRRITSGWLGAAPEVVLSHPLREDDRELSPSPLVAHIAEGTLALPMMVRVEDALHAAGSLEPVPAVAAPPLSATNVRGGSRVLADQSACAFRAFAAHRLAAQPLESPAQGLDAAARGNLLHALMKGIWDELKTQAALLAATRDELDAVIERAAMAAVARVRRDVAIEDGLAALERRRLAKLARDWLDIERGRAPFEVVASEDKRPLAAAGLVFSGRIDRMDRLSDGTHALIDYKTGSPTPRWWGEGQLGDRPQDPQLPLYAVNAEEDVSAVVFAKLKTGGMRLMGYSRSEGAVERKKVRVYHDWDGLMSGWKAELNRLGTAFTAGEAEVDPKKPGLTCRFCALAPLCRVHERFSALALEEGAVSGNESSDADDAGEAGGGGGEE